nr:MAG TPA_asm: hypothetical protein [Bacteriophage sp.]
MFQNDALFLPLKITFKRKSLFSNVNTKKKHYNKSNVSFNYLSCY